MTEVEIMKNVTDHEPLVLSPSAHPSVAASPTNIITKMSIRSQRVKGIVAVLRRLCMAKKKNMFEPSDLIILQLIGSSVLTSDFGGDRRKFERKKGRRVKPKSLHPTTWKHLYAH